MASRSCNSDIQGNAMLLRKIFLIEILAKLNYCLWLQVVLQGDFIMRCCENPMRLVPIPRREFSFDIAGHEIQAAVTFLQGKRKGGK